MTITKKFEPAKEEKISRWKTRKYLFFAGSFLIALMIIEIWVSHRTSTYGEKMKEIEILQARISLENQLLENEVAKEGSIQRVASTSSTLGFITPKDIKFIR